MVIVLNVWISFNWTKICLKILLGLLLLKYLFFFASFFSVFIILDNNTCILLCVVSEVILCQKMFVFRKKKITRVLQLFSFTQLWKGGDERRIAHVCIWEVVCLCDARTQYGRDSHSGPSCCWGSYRGSHLKGGGVPWQLGVKNTILELLFILALFQHCLSFLNPVFFSFVTFFYMTPNISPFWPVL